jgi:DNA-binding CsgD family transcriptional regulator
MSNKSKKLQTTALAEIVLDSLSAQVAILDENGKIIEVNRAWLEFERQNSPPGSKGSSGMNYLDICDRAEGPGSEEAHAVAYGIRGVLKGELAEFALEYPCHSPSQRRWFNVRAAPLRGEGQAGVLLSHENITNVKLAQEALRQSEEDLRRKSRMLSESNTALKVLLRQRDQDRKELEDKITARVAGLVLPHVERLFNSGLDAEQRSWLEILRTNLLEIISPFAQRLSSKLVGLTPSELQVADLIKQGRSSQEIADLMNLSKRTIDFHRDNLRKKLGLKSRKANLRTYLMSLD